MEMSKRALGVCFCEIRCYGGNVEIITDEEIGLKQMVKGQGTGEAICS